MSKLLDSVMARIARPWSGPIAENRIFSVSIDDKEWAFREAKIRKDLPGFSQAMTRSRVSNLPGAILGELYGAREAGHPDPRSAVRIGYGYDRGIDFTVDGRTFQHKHWVADRNFDKAIQSDRWQFILTPQDGELLKATFGQFSVISSDYGRLILDWFTADEFRDNRKKRGLKLGEEWSIRRESMHRWPPPWLP